MARVALTFGGNGWDDPVWVYTGTVEGRARLRVCGVMLYQDVLSYFPNQMAL